MVVAGLWRYPVKSMRGERLDEAEIDGRGAVGDRAWAVTFPDGRVGSGKNYTHGRRLDGLLGYRASTVDDDVVVDSPLGIRYGVKDAALADELSELAETAVALALEGAVGHFDVGEIHLVSTGDLAALGMDVTAIARFRPNVLVESDLLTAELPAGRRFAFGDLVMEVTGPTDRCVMTTMRQPHLPADRDVLHTIVREFGGNVGCYLKPVELGTIRVGDAAQLS